MLGMNIYNLRKSNSMNQEDLAKVLNVSRQAISKWERDESTPDLEKLLLMAKVFNVTVDDLLDGEFDLSNYEVPNNSIFSIFDKESLKLIALGGMIINILGSVFSLYGLASMHAMTKSGITPTIDTSGIFTVFIKDFYFLLVLLLMFNILVTSTTVVIYQSYKKELVNKRLRFFVIGFGAFLIVFGQSILGLIYLGLGIISTHGSIAISKNRVLQIISLTVFVYVVTYSIMYSMTGYFTFGGLL